jgi:hypothetical protein
MCLGWGGGGGVHARVYIHMEWAQEGEGHNEQLLERWAALCNARNSNIRDETAHG